VGRAVASATLNREEWEEQSEVNAVECGRLRKERDHLEAKFVHLKDVYEDLGIKWGDDPFHAIKLIRKERDELRAENERIKKRCAELEKALRMQHAWHQHNKETLFEWPDGEPDSFNAAQEYEDSLLCEVTLAALNPESEDGSDV
jgi:hypothetical protein